MAVTQNDIAKKIGLSRSLVSRVLSGKARDVAISEETIKNVTRVAKEMGYVPNIAAQTLMGVPTRTIGVMVSFFSDPFFGQIVDALLRRAKELDYSVVLSGFHFDAEPTPEELRPLLKHKLDGLIVVGSSEHIEWMNELSRNGVPISRVGHGPGNEISNRIAIDEDKAMRLILEHLKSNGCRQVVYLGFEESSPISRTRLAGFQKHARTLKIKDPSSSQIHISSDIPSGIKSATDQILGFSSRPQAVICANDHIALHLIDELLERNISVPKDMAVVGIDNIPLSQVFRPRLTTIHQPVAELVALAFDTVVEGKEPREIILEPQLIVRESSLFGTSGNS